MWRPALGRGTKLRQLDHRSTGRSWNAFSLYSAYGNTQKAAPAWLRQALVEAEGLPTPAQAVVGKALRKSEGRGVKLLLCNRVFDQATITL